MALWKRGKRYWCLIRIRERDILHRQPLCPPGSKFATTDWRVARQLEKDVLQALLDGKITPSSAGAAGHPTRLFAACDAYLEAKRATANTERAIEIDRDCLKAIRRVIGDVPLKAIVRETIERFQSVRRAEGKKPRTINMEVGALRKVLKRFRHWRRLEDDVQMLAESKEPVGRVLSHDERVRLLEVAQSRPAWQHVYCAAVLASNTSMRGVEVKNLRRKDVYLEKRVVHIRHSKNETSRRIIPLNDPALEAVAAMLRRLDDLGFTEPDHYLWFAMPLAEAMPERKVDLLKGPLRRTYDPTRPQEKWDNTWRALRKAAGVPWLRFHDLRHTVVTELLEAGEPDHVVESITGHLSRRMLEHYSHVRIQAKKGALDRLAEARGKVAGQ